MCNTHCFSTATMVAWTRFHIRLYSIACLLFYTVTQTPHLTHFLTLCVSYFGIHFSFSVCMFTNFFWSQPRQVSLSLPPPATLTQCWSLIKYIYPTSLFCSEITDVLVFVSSAWIKLTILWNLSPLLWSTEMPVTGLSLKLADVNTMRRRAYLAVTCFRLACLLHL
jgi:hypothetical protein